MAENRKIVMFHGEELGNVGENIGVNFHKVQVHVGDLVAYSVDGKSDIHAVGVVTKNRDKSYYIMGYWGTDISDEDCNIKVRQVVVPHYLMTTEILQHHHSDGMEIIEKKVVELTIEQIEEELGYKIKLV